MKKEKVARGRIIDPRRLILMSLVKISSKFPQVLSLLAYRVEYKSNNQSHFLRTLYCDLGLIVPVLKQWAALRTHCLSMIVPPQE